MQQTISSPVRPTSYRQTIAVTHIGFVLTGVVTVLLGPALPALQARWALSDAQAGYLFTAQFIGSIMPLAAMSLLVERLGLLRLLTCGYAFMAIGIAGLGVNSWAVGIASVFCYGVGLGLTIPATNLLISEMNRERRAAALSVVNFTWGIGAVATAPVVGLLTESNKTTTGLIVLALLLLLVMARLVRFNSLALSCETTEQAKAKRKGYLSPYTLLFGALIFLYVGTENAVAGWVGTHALRMEGSLESNWKIVPSVFWAALLSGRAIAPLALRRIAEERLALAGLLTALCGTMTLLLTSKMAGLVLGVALAGIGFASIYPITVAQLPRVFGADATRVVGLVFMLAGLGGATMPWAVGLLSHNSGSLRLGLLVPLIGNLLMIALQFAVIVALKRIGQNTKTQGAHR